MIIDSTIHDNLAALPATTLAQLLILRYGISAFNYEYVYIDDEGTEHPVTLESLASASPEVIGRVFDDNEHDDAINEIRHLAEVSYHLVTWCDRSWGRHYDINVCAFVLPDSRALAFNWVTGGGKHGEPDSYRWEKEVKYVRVADVKEVTTRKYTFAEL